MPSYRFALISTGLLIAGAAVAGLLAVQPSTAHPDPQTSFAAMDANHDGQVTGPEYASAMPANRIFIIHRDGSSGAAPPHQGGMRTFTVPLSGEPPAMQGARPATTEERDTLAARQFALADANGDGRVTLDEYSARERAEANQHFVALDANGDGRITQREFATSIGPGGDLPAPLQTQFTRLDANHDGAVTPDEFGHH